MSSKQVKKFRAIALLYSFLAMMFMHNAATNKSVAFSLMLTALAGVFNVLAIAYAIESYDMRKDTTP